MVSKPVSPCFSDRMGGFRKAAVAVPLLAVLLGGSIVLGCKTGPVPREQRQDESLRYEKHCRGRLCEEGR